MGWQRVWGHAHSHVGRRGQLSASLRIDPPDQSVAVGVADHRMRLAAHPDQSRQLARNPNTWQQCVCHQRQAFPREVVDHAQDAEPPAARQGVGDEVQRPALVRPVRQHHWRPRAQGALATAATTDP